MITKDEAREYDIASDECDYADANVRRAFWRILDIARERCGFDTTGEKVLIQYYPSESGGEIFVTKLGHLASATERTLQKSQNVAMLSSRRLIYKFSELESLIGACKRTGREAADREAQLYFSDDGCYYLFLEERATVGAPSDLSHFSEFATEIPTVLEPYIIEHSRCILGEDTIKTLSAL